MSHSTSTEFLLSVLRAEIAALTPGERLASTRQIIERHHVSPVTVSRALALLAGEGLVETRPGAGTYKSGPRAPSARADVSWQSLTLGERTVRSDGLSAVIDPARQDGTISLATGYLHPSLMPTRLLASAWTRAARLPDAFDRPPAEGLASLRAWFARSADPSLRLEPRDVLITPGGQAAVAAAMRAVVPTGEPLLVESPSYPGALSLAGSMGVRAVPVPADECGVSPEALADAFERTRARAVYLQPTFSNPTGSVLASERRAGVLEAARQAGAFVIEDDYARWLGHGGRSVPPLLSADTDGRVIYITSLTKATAPSLRVGAIIARGPVLERMKLLRVIEDMFVPRPAQEAALELVTSRGWERHLRGLGRALGDRAEAMATGIRRLLPGIEVGPRPLGGIHLWVALPAALDDTEVVAAARSAGVLVHPGRAFYPTEPAGPRLRLTFSAAADAAEIDEGLSRLARAVPALTAGT